MATRQKAANIQNVHDSPMDFVSERKNWLTIQALSQLNAVAIETIRPRISRGKISLMTVQTIGPIENANEAIYVTSATTVTQPQALEPPVRTG